MSNTYVIASDPDAEPTAQEIMPLADAVQAVGHTEGLDLTEDQIREALSKSNGADLIRGVLDDQDVWLWRIDGLDLTPYAEGD